MFPRREDCAWIAPFIKSHLRFAEKPVPRDELVEKVRDHAWNALGIGWKPQTAARRVREALEALLDSDTPVISAGGGFKFASRATAAERERAARLREQVAQKEWAAARKIRAVTLPGDPVMGELFPEARP
jgi:hypothetical protein